VFEDLAQGRQGQSRVRHDREVCRAGDGIAEIMTKKTRFKIAKGARSTAPFAPVEDAVAAIRRGEMVIVVDDEDRENEGDLTMAAEKVTPDAINFMAKRGRGLICMPMTGERLDKLEIPLMVEKNSTRFETAFCVAIEAKRATPTGTDVP